MTPSPQFGQKQSSGQFWQFSGGDSQIKLPQVAEGEIFTLST